MANFAGDAWAFRNLLDAYICTKDAEDLGLLMSWQDAIQLLANAAG